MYVVLYHHLSEKHKTHVVAILLMVLALPLLSSIHFKAHVFREIGCVILKGMTTANHNQKYNKEEEESFCPLSY